MTRSEDVCSQDNREFKELRPSVAATKTSEVKCFEIIPCWSPLDEMGKVFFLLIDSDGFHVKAEPE